ncbi:MAG: heparan-alpha-glucosaminide N-acetyltransferase domain-containing protein [Pirellulaceae bacterium]
MVDFAFSKPSENISTGRIAAVDALRGLVIVLMALDHSRDFFGDMRINPLTIETTTMPLFFTRWITHFCAPTFVFLAGVSAWLFGSKQKTKFDVARFLFTRGLWLIILDFTVVHFALGFSMTALPWMFLVLSAIGVSMIMLSLLCFLPARLVGAIGCLIIVTHNLLDPISIEGFGFLGVAWKLIHDRPSYLPQLNLEVAYSVLPWFGVAAAGYGFAPVLRLPPENRRKVLFATGLTLIVAFLIVRGANHYGDPNSWNWQAVSASSTADGAVTTRPNLSIAIGKTTMSFLNCINTRLHWLSC